MPLCWPFVGTYIKLCLIEKTSTIEHKRKRKEHFTSKDICQQRYLGLEETNIHIWGKQVHWEHANKMKLKQLE